MLSSWVRTDILCRAEENGNWCRIAIPSTGACEGQKEDRARLGISMQAGTQAALRSPRGILAGGTRSLHEARRSSRVLSKSPLALGVPLRPGRETPDPARPAPVDSPLFSAVAQTPCSEQFRGMVFLDGQRSLTTPPPRSPLPRLLCSGGQLRLTHSASSFLCGSPLIFLASLFTWPTSSSQGMMRIQHHLSLAGGPFAE